MFSIPRSPPASRRCSKKRKALHSSDDHIYDMAYLAQMSARHLQPPAAPMRKQSQRTRDEVDDFLSSDLEVSFASTMSLNSPPASPQRQSASSANLHPSASSPMPMDISPAPQHRSNVLLVPHITRPRAFTVRTFGRELVNQPSSPCLSTSFKSEGTNRSSGKRLQRAALPFEWMSSTLPPQQEPSIISIEPQEASISPAKTDAMDVDPIDSSSSIPLAHSYTPSSPVPVSAAPTITGFSNLFFETMSPVHGLTDLPAAGLPKKRRSVSPERSYYDYNGESDAHSSSPAPPSSPSQRKFERFASTGGLFRKTSKQLLVASGASSSIVAPLNKRARRPTISALVQPDNNILEHTHSAFPVLTSAEANSNARNGDKENVANCKQRQVLPPPRRAFSAMIPPAGSGSGADTSSDVSVDASSPVAQAYAKRQSMKTLRRRDGTDDFRPLTGATAMREHDANVNNVLTKAEVVNWSPSLKFMSAGMPGFGDNEAHGKVLPCHRVAEDGLMRINTQTLDELLDGTYNSQISDFYVIDCRFNYEYAGGHIPGAINMHTSDDIEQFLLGSGRPKPEPSCSGDGIKKTVLVFHCEFSAKRAPTFAKHLRSKDRAANNKYYPRIHYPEVYILSGGYCQYYKDSASRCQPGGYVRMDDPAHSNSREEDMDQFRKAKFGRTKSYAYGDMLIKLSSAAQSGSQPKRNTAPSGGGGVTSLFAAANAARTRRGGGGLATLDEDGGQTTMAMSDDETEIDIGDSPCPPPNKGAALSKANRLPSRGPLERAHTFGTLKC